MEFNWNLSKRSKRTNRFISGVQRKKPRSQSMNEIRKKKKKKMLNAIEFKGKDKIMNAPIQLEMFDGTWTKMAAIGDFDTSIVEHLENPYFFFSKHSVFIGLSPTK